MSESFRSLIRRAAAAACLSIVGALPAAGQQPAEAKASPEFLSAYDFHLSASALDSNDLRFSWDTHFGGDFDVVDYVYGRTYVLADYEAILGSELRAFDPNQGNYTLAVATSARVGGVEAFVMLHHVSRHLSDRAKRFPIAWNDVEGIVVKRLTSGNTTVDLRGAAGKIVAYAYVDYSWTVSGEMRVDHRTNQHLSLFGRAFGETYGIDSSRSARPQQNGARLEAGVRVNGSAGAVELFGGYERMVDAAPLDATREGWAFLGFRVLNR